MAAVPRDADAIVVGAGPAGSTTAGLLAQAGYDVLLLDRCDFPRDKSCGDGLSPRAVAALQRLGMLAELQAAGYLPVPGARVTGADGRVFRVKFGDYDLGLPNFALVVPRRDLDDRLRRRAMALGARFRPRVRVTRLLLGRGRVGGVEAEMDGRRTALAAPLTVVATGANIGLLQPLGLFSEMPAGLNAMRGYYRDVPDLSGDLEIFFGRDIMRGYNWIFPLGDGRANVGVGVSIPRRSLPAPNTHRLLAEFVAAHPALREAQPEGRPMGYPLRTDFPRFVPAIGGLLVVGEALGLVDPLSGAGLELAFESGELAAEVAGAALALDDTGPAALGAFARRIKARNAGFFRAAKVAGPLTARLGVLTNLLSRSQSNPALGRLHAGITLGLISPWQALSPRAWRQSLTQR